MPEAIVVDQDEIPGTGRAVELAVAALPDDFDGEVVVVSGDVPLLDADTLGELIAEHRAATAAATVLSAILDDPTGYGRIVRDADGGVDRIVEQKDATDDELRDRRDQLGHLRLRGRRSAHQLAAHRHRQRAGRAVPHGCRRPAARGRASRSRRSSTASWLVAGINDRVQLARGRRCVSTR